MSRVKTDQSDPQGISGWNPTISPTRSPTFQYFVTGLPKDITRDDKLARVSELADTITNIKSSDVLVISMWIGA